MPSAHMTIRTWHAGGVVGVVGVSGAIGGAASGLDDSAKDLRHFSLKTGVGGAVALGVTGAVALGVSGAVALGGVGGVGGLGVGGGGLGVGGGGVGVGLDVSGFLGHCCERCPLALQL